jgi:hypothetical protein
MHLRTLIQVVVVTSIALSAAGCSTPRLYYETTVFRHEPLRRDQRAALVQTVQSRLGDRSLEVPHKGGWRQVHPSGGLDGVDGPMLYAVVALADDDYLGAEADLIIHGPGRRRTPITVEVGLDGSVYVAKGGKRPPARKWVKGGGVLGAALARLSKRERAVLKTVRWRRSKRAGGSGKGGHYRQKGCDAEIHIYDLAFAGDGLQFVGGLAQPGQSSTRAILHEVAHAIHHRPARRAWCAYEDHRKHGRDVAARKSAGFAESIEERGPVLAAFEAALDGNEAPTVYGEESLAEAFAESFSLFKTDPAALERVLPDVARWFANGGHVEALAK